MPTLKLTLKTIEKARADAVKAQLATFAWDESLKGFGLRIGPTGKASWVVKKYLGAGGRSGRQVRSVFAAYEELSIEQARDQAIKLIGEIRQGSDLADRKRHERSAQHALYASGRLGDVVDAYIKRNSDGTRYWQEIRRRFDTDIIPNLGASSLVAKITKAEVRSLIEVKEDKHPGAARNLFSTLRPLFKWCVSRELITTSPMDGLSAPKPLPSRDRVLTDDEVKAIWFASEKLGYPFTPFYRLLVLTAQRREEVAGMRWTELVLDAGHWIIPKERTKNGKEHVVHLSPQALAVLKAIPKRDDCDFVLTTTGTTPVSGYSRAKANLDCLTGIATPWKVHDLRRTAASGMASLGFLPHVIERVLNHVSGAQGGLVGVYQRYEYADERKKALAAWGNHVEALITDTPIADNIVLFRA